MADNVDKITLDTSAYDSALSRLSASLKKHGQEVDSVGVTYVDFGKRGGQLKAGFEAILSTGEKLDGIFKKTKTGIEALVTSMDKVTAATKAFSAAQSMQAGGSSAANFMKMAGIPDAAGMKASIMDAFRTVQQDLAKAIGADPANTKIADEIFGKLKNGVVQVETGIRGKIQGALLDVLRLAERIEQVQSRLNKPAPPPATATGMTSAELATARGQVTGILPLDPRASVSAVTSYQAAVNALMATVARSKIGVNEFQQLLSSVSRNPTGDFAGTNQQLAQVQSALQRVIVAYGSMKNAASTAGEAGQRSAQSLIISFEQFVKLLEVQIVHRAFGNFLTAMQRGVTQAAELKIKIAEVMTLAQGTGINQDVVERTVRSRSEQFNRPETDVAEAFYAGLSNQVIKTTSDIQVLDAALVLSRTTVSSVADSINALSSVMKSYGLANVQASQTSAELFRIVDLGRFRLSDIASSIGRVTVVGGQMGVSFQEIGAIMSHLSVSGLTAHETMTQVSAIMNTFMKPSEAMSRVLRSWGFETGEAAVRTLTLTGAIERLHREVESGRYTLGELSPNIRSIRGLAGSADTEAIRRNLAAITNSGESASSADTVVAENVGTKFQQELLKIQNAVIEFGSSTITELNKLAAPWGGIASAVIQVGSAFGETAKMGLEFVSAGNSILAIVKATGGDLGTLVKLYLTYKATMALATGVTTVWTAALAQLAAIKLYVATVDIEATIGQTVYTLSQMKASAANIFNTTGLFTNIGAKVANIAVTAGLTAAQTALAGSVWLVNAAMVASPFIAIGILIAGVTGQLDALSHQYSVLKQNMDAFAQTSDRLRPILERQARDNTTSVQNRESGFNNLLARTEQRGGDVFAELTRRSNSLVDAQREVVKTLTDNVKVNLRSIADEMGQAISRVNARISEARNIQRQSLSREAAFADRDASANFQHSFNALSRGPEFVNPIDASSGQGQEQLRQEQIKFRIESQQFDMQKELIARRIATLQAEATRLTQSGNREDIESARRKFEEIRRLTTQQFDLQSNFNQREAQNAVLTGRQSGGMDGVLRYNVPVQQLRRDLDALTAAEGRAEEAIRSRQAAVAENAQRERAALVARQEAIAQAIRGVEQMNVLDARGQVNARFTGPQGLQNFTQDFAARRAALQAAMENAGTTTNDRGEQVPVISFEARLQIMQSLTAQESAMRMQVEREVAAVALQADRNAFERRLADIRRLRTEMLNRETDVASTRTQLLQDVTSETDRMSNQVRDADNLLQSRNIWHPLRNGPGQDVVDQRRDNYTQTLPELNAAREAFATAGPEQQAEAQRRLQAAIDATSRAYRSLFSLAGDRTLTGSTQTGQQILEQRTPLQDSAARLQAATAAAATVRADIEQSTLQLQGLRGEVERASIGLGASGASIITLGQNANAQAPAIDTFTASIGRLADQLSRLEGASLPGAANPASPNFVGPRRANGGLIGNSFNSRGPDNVMAMVRTGEFVVNPESTSRFYSQLVAMNAGQMPSFSKGGIVGGSSVTNVGDISINVNDSGDPNATARAVMGLLSRETRRGNRRQ